ncbi:MAG: hypothetical protein GY822_20505 [Deltaproteobacteria bacterium]|nr:hypothetical protein [Deltaproteobacteria bacterium]
MTAHRVPVSSRLVSLVSGVSGVSRVLRSCKIGLGWALLAVLFLDVSSAKAAQIVAFDLKAVGAVRKSMAESLSPILLAQLARQDGMSVVSQADIRALLELEGAKAAMGCDEGGCMAEIAGSLGAELLVTSALSKVGREWVVSMTVIQVDGAKILRRSTGKGRGKVEDAATVAIENAVHQLFKGALPTELQGPASMTRRGFKAALAGLHQAMLDPALDPQASRRRIVLDLVATELDYDASPKLDMLDLRIRRERGDCNNRIGKAKAF